MYTSAEQFITQMKFRELRVQRDTSLAAYGALGHELAEAADDATRLRILYRGLRDLRFAKQPLHPDVANLEPLLRDLDHGEASTETLSYWRAELERELLRGQLRSEIVYVFGALLEEGAAEDLTTENQDQVARDERTAQMERIARQPQGNGADRAEFLQTVFDEFQLPPLAELRAVTRSATDENVYQPLTYTPRGNVELEAILERMTNDRYRSSGLRSQARRFRQNPTLLKELSDALAILIDHIEEWDWPEDGVAAHTEWAGNKWRLFLDEDLPTACLLELLGGRWQQAFARVLKGAPAHRIKRLERLHEIGAPAIIIENEQSLLMASASAPPDFATVDIWAEEDAGSPRTSRPEDGAAQTWSEPGSILMRRASLLGELRSFDRFDAYGETGAASGVETALRLVHAEVGLGRAAFPNQPVYIIKLDLRDYYPSVPHDVVLSVLTRLGVAERDLSFFRRYLSTRINDDTGLVTARSGLPNRRRLSDLLGESLLLLLDAYVRRRANVQIVRLVDDICLIAASPTAAVAAWDAVQAFCAGCGLHINDEKSGAICIGGELPPGLPATSVRWQLLTLTDQGQWVVDELAFERFLDQTRRQLAMTSSVIAQARQYNEGLTYLEHAIGLSLRLGPEHRRSVNDAMRRYHRSLFGDAQGIADLLRRAIHERFLRTSASAQLPEAWLYWPITAGGLGLRHAGLLAATHAESFDHQAPPVLPLQRPADWQRKDNEWARFYGALLDQVEPAAPAPNKVMEALVKDFIARGAGLSAGQQRTLSTYWRWILYIYGPQILDAFGTFRFLFSELVPLRLITERQLGDGETEEEF
ncbi:MAG TPA: reverse transcriptase domain-containing protein [Ktedonobacterales bacterium]|nr:reverse transcriptase domain-containing protein [Ktedonobacterales bacterium]